MTVTLPKVPCYNITCTETVTWTAPCTTHSGSSNVTGCPTFDVCPDGSSVNPPQFGALGLEIGLGRGDKPRIFEVQLCEIVQLTSG